jgi:hypothetical protein
MLVLRSLPEGLDSAVTVKLGLFATQVKFPLKYIRHDRGMENALQGYGHIFKIILQVPSKSFVTVEQYIGL